MISQERINSIANSIKNSSNEKSKVQGIELFDENNRINLPCFIRLTGKDFFAVEKLLSEMTLEYILVTTTELTLMI